jgi:hypothetical protein
MVLQITVFGSTFIGLDRHGPAFAMPEQKNVFEHPNVRTEKLHSACSVGNPTPSNRSKPHFALL